MARHNPRTPANHWRRTRLLAIAIISTWAVVTLALPFFSVVSNDVRAGGSAAYVMVSQGVLILILALMFWFARRQQVIDREFAMAQED